MKRDKNPSAKTAELRRRAEERLKAGKAEPVAPTEKDALRLLHELQVHQIELEMQGEELRQSAAEMEAGLKRYADLYDFAPVGYLTLGHDGAIRQANLTGARLLGEDRTHLSGRRFGIFVCEADRPMFNAFLEKVFTSQRKEVCEVALLNEGKELLHVQITATVMRDGQECSVIIVDITGRKRTEEALREGETRYRSLFENMVEGFAFCRMLYEDNRPQDFVYLAVNDAFQALTGLKDVVGKKVSEVIPGIREADPELFLRYGRVASTGRPERFEFYLASMKIWFHLSVYSPGKDYFVAVFDDITQRKQADLERETSVEFLRFMNTCTNSRDLIKESSIFIQRKSGCEAVGVRLREGDDYPYYEARGFPAAFVTAENSLCAKTETGEILRDSLGNPALECMCGNVINGRIDPSQPFFTPNGSFWTNSTTALLSSTSEADRQARTRNRCHGEGFESVALIPLFVGNERIGLLQLNDRRKGLFNLEAITLWERLAGYLSVTLTKLRAEEALRESEEKYRRIVQTSKEGIWAMDSNYLTTFVNQRMADMLGYTPVEMIGRRVDTFMFPEDLGDHSVRMEARKQGEGGVYERRFRRKDGGALWTIVSATALRDAEGKFTGSFGMFTDITERKQAEAEIRDSEERNRRLVEALPDAIIFRSGGLITYANPAAVKLFRANRMEELIGKRYLELVHPDDRAESTERVRKNMEENWVAPPREHRLIALDGQVVEVESTGVPVKIRGGVQTFGVFRDITEQKKSHQEKEKLEAQLQQAQKMEALGTLAGGIAHDFNNILSVIIGSSELLELKEVVEDSSRQTLDNVLQASQRAKELVRQILAFSRHAKQEKILLNFKSIIKETLEFLRASLPSSIQIRQYLDPAAGTIMADPTQMQQILMNLCTNAGHAMEKDGGVMQINLANVTLNAEDVRFDPDLEPGGYVRLTVSDTGHGMEPSVIQRIFEPYFTTKELGKGTGLGLAVVHGIVKAHNGMINVYSEAGKGTTFKVFLPRAEGYDGVGEMKPAASIPKGSERILLVDDEKALADIEKQLLNWMGYEVEIRTSPIEAIEAFRANPQKFDLVLTDMTMPQMTGIKMAKQMIEIRTDIPVIVCTGFSDQINEDQALSAGVKALLLKPVVAREMSEAIRKALKK
jgi:PAS domain S-box-containing protein